MNHTLRGMFCLFWVSIVSAVVTVVTLLFVTRRRDAWLRYTAAEAGFYIRLGLPMRFVESMRRFGESRAAVITLRWLLGAFLLFALINGGSYRYYKGRLDHKTSPNKQPSPLTVEEFIKAEQKRLTQFQVVAYATVNTNNVPDIVLTVSEVWKGHQEARALGVTNGTQFSTRWSVHADFLPDCAIIYIPRTLEPTEPFLGGGALFPKNGWVSTGLTVRQYKASLGL